jgi:hypothetical protein
MHAIIGTVTLLGPETGVTYKVYIYIHIYIYIYIYIYKVDIEAFSLRPSSH